MILAWTRIGHVLPLGATSAMRLADSVAKRASAGMPGCLSPSDSPPSLHVSETADQLRPALALFLAVVIFST